MLKVKTLIELIIIMWGKWQYSNKAHSLRQYHLKIPLIILIELRFSAAETVNIGCLWLIKQY